MESVRFYVSGDNLLTWTGISSIFDPETLGGDWGPGKLYPLLDLVGAFINRGDLRLPVGPLHIHTLHEAGAAIDLERVVGDFQRDVGGVHLGHGGFHAVGGVRLLQLGGGVHQEPGAAELGGHVGDLKGDGLLEADGLAELDALLGVGHGGVIGPLGDAQRLGRDTDAAAVQGGHGDLEAVALLAQQVLPGHFHIVKDQLGSGGGADAHFVVVVAEVEALPALLHDEGADAPGADIRCGDGKDHIGVRLGGVGNEDFAAVEDIGRPSGRRWSQCRRRRIRRWAPSGRRRRSSRPWPGAPGTCASAPRCRRRRWARSLRRHGQTG